jgi:hypothetical protein
MQLDKILVKSVRHRLAPVGGVDGDFAATETFRACVEVA